MPMPRFRPGLIWLLLLCLPLACAGPRPWPQTAPPLQPGRYLTAYYRSPDLHLMAARWRLGDWQLQQLQGLSPEQALALLRAELTAAFAANGLVFQEGEADYVVSGTVNRWQLSPPFWRWLSGRGTVILEVTGEIRRQQELVFAFYDRLKLTPAINPRRQPTLEPELLARLAARRFAANLLNELLLPEGRVQIPAED